MTALGILNTAIGRRQKTKADAAEILGIAPQRISYRVTKDTMKAEELLRLLDALDLEIVLRDRTTGELVEVNDFRKGHGRHVRKMADRVTYDTEMSGAIANSFYEDGENEYGALGVAEELYLDRQGRYFIVEYNRDDPSKDRVSPVSANVAKAFIEKYGTEIEKN